MAKLSRRELGRLAGGLAAARAVTLRAQGASRPAYNGPLTGVTTDLRDRPFDPVAYTRGLYEAAPRQLRFRAGNRGDAEAHGHFGVGELQAGELRQHRGGAVQL